MPRSFLCAAYVASIRARSSTTPGPVATTVARIGLPESLIASSAPSMRGWMLSCPGVAMKRKTSPLWTSSAIRAPNFSPDW